MLIYFATAFFVCLAGSTWAQYYAGQPQQAYSPQHQQNAEAWRRWHFQHRQQQNQQASYNSGPPRPTNAMASPAGYPPNTNYYSQRQPQQASAASPQYSQPQYQQYYQQQQPQGYQPRQPPMGYAPQSYGSYQQPQNNYRPPPPPVTHPPLTTPAVPVEVEYEMEVPTTTTTARPRPSYSQWGHYSQNYGSGSPYGGQYQPSSYQQNQYQQPGQAQPSGYSNYYQQPPQQQQPSAQQPQSQQQPQYSQNSWTQQPQQQGSYGSQQPPAHDPTDPFATKFDMNSLKPTVFNTQYQNQAPQNPTQTPTSEYAGIFGDQNAQRQNPNAPSGKVDYGSKGPNPIQLNQFLAQPTPAKDTNALDALLGTLLSGTVAVQSSQQASSSYKPTPTTTKAPPQPPPSSLVSDRLNGFVLGPKSEYRSNMFSEIPVNNAAYDNLNPLAGFMGETPPPPLTTTPVPPGRNGDFLEGFIGVNKVVQPSRPVRDSFQPNIYVYNPMNEVPIQTTPPPSPPALSDQAFNNMGTQDLSAMVQKLLGVLATKTGPGQGQGQGQGQG